MIPESERTCSVCAKLIPHGEQFWKVGNHRYCDDCYCEHVEPHTTPTPEAHDGDE